MHRISSAFSKLVFCLKITGSVGSFVKLVVNTKKNSFGYSKSDVVGNAVASGYELSINHTRRLLSMRTFTGDIDIFYEIFWKKIYDRIPATTERTQTVIDLGANIGIASLFFSVKFPNARIYAVEPDPDNFDLLLSNMKPEILEQRCIPVHAAIASGTGVAYIHKSAKAYNTKISTDAVSALTVRTIDLNMLFKECGISHIDLLKIDIEGAEMEIFSGDVSFLQRVSNIVVECHSPSITTHCQTVLRQQGFRLTIVEPYMNLIWGTK